MDEELHRPVRVRIAELDSSFQAVGEALFRLWMDGKVRLPEIEGGGSPVATGLTEQEQNLSARLIHLLRHGNPEIAAMVRNLVASQPAPASEAKKQKTG